MTNIIRFHDNKSYFEMMFYPSIPRHFEFWVCSPALASAQADSSARKPSSFRSSTTSWLLSKFSLRTLGVPLITMPNRLIFFQWRERERERERNFLRCASYKGWIFVRNSCAVLNIEKTFCFGDFFSESLKIKQKSTSMKFILKMESKNIRFREV